MQDVLSPIGMTGEAEMSRYSRRDLGQYYMDAKLSGGNWQCDWGDGTCQEMEDEIQFAEKDDAERSNQFKYVFDVSRPELGLLFLCSPLVGGCLLMGNQTDGNAWSSRFPRLMASHK